MTLYLDTSLIVAALSNEAMTPRVQTWLTFAAQDNHGLTQQDSDEDGAVGDHQLGRPVSSQTQYLVFAAVVEHRKGGTPHRNGAKLLREPRALAALEMLLAQRSRSDVRIASVSVSPVSRATCRARLSLSLSFKLRAIGRTRIE